MGPLIPLLMASSLNFKARVGSLIRARVNENICDVFIDHTIFTRLLREHFLFFLVVRTCVSAKAENCDYLGVWKRNCCLEIYLIISVFGMDHKVHLYLCCVIMKLF